jgi:hypothetical protein
MKTKLYTFFLLIILFISFNNNIVQATSPTTTLDPWDQVVNDILNPKTTTTTPTTVPSLNNLEIYPNNIGYMTWYEALEAVKLLGNGWRLPTRDELNLMYINKDTIGNFGFDYYCTSSVSKDPYGSEIPLVWAQSFGVEDGVEGLQNQFGTSSIRTYYIRPVRTLEPLYNPKVPITTSTTVDSPSWISTQFSIIRKNQMQLTTIIISFTLIILSIVYVFYKRIQHNNDFKFMQFEHNAELDKYKVYELSKTQMDQDYDVKLKQVEYDKSIKDRDFMMTVTKEERDYMLKQRELDIREQKNPNQLMDVIEQNKDVQFRIKK